MMIRCLIWCRKCRYLLRALLCLSFGSGVFGLRLIIQTSLGSSSFQRLIVGNFVR
jgi:hypothetical protein